MLNILFVSAIPVQYNMSSNLRNRALMYGLWKLGNKVDVCSFKPNKDYFRYDESLKFDFINNFYYVANDISGKSNDNRKKSAQKRDKLTIRKVIASVYNKFSVWDIRYFPVKNSNIPVIDNSYDLIISSSDPKSSHILAQMIKKKNKGKTGAWIQYWGDPFTFDVSNRSLVPKRIIEKTEAKLIDRADEVVYVSPFTKSMEEKIHSEYCKKMHFIDRPVMNNVEIDYTNKVSENNSSSLNIGYFGQLYKGRNISPLYKAIVNSNHKLHIFCTDIYDPEGILVETDNVFINGRLDVTSCYKREEQMDVLVCLCNETGTQIPGKFYDYATTNKHVLAIIDGETVELRQAIKDYLSSFNRFIICENNENSILYALDHLFEYNHLRKPCDSFSPEIVAQKFVDLMA